MYTCTIFCFFSLSPSSATSVVTSKKKRQAYLILFRYRSTVLTTVESKSVGVSLKLGIFLFLGLSGVCQKSDGVKVKFLFFGSRL